MIVLDFEGGGFYTPFKRECNRMRTRQIPVVTSLLRSLAINLLNINKISNKFQTRKLFAWGL